MVTITGEEITSDGQVPEGSASFFPSWMEQLLRPAPRWVWAPSGAARDEGAIQFVSAFGVFDPRLPLGEAKRSGWGRKARSLGIRDLVNLQTVAGGPRRCHAR